ncbi:MAG TPA: flagellar hook-length control protein FliK [Pirellulaceae bacterium]|nr:flagellar hook-length control protein FliK [Pirellulaceae bacterium]
MVPFSFENITRAAALDSLKAVPVSAAARATHESFESHLDRATAFTPAPSTRQTARGDESRERPTAADAVREDAVREDAVREDATAVTEATSKPDAAHTDEDREQESVMGNEVVVSAASEVQRALVQELEPQASGDSDDNANDEAASKLANAALSEEEAELDMSLAVSAEATDETGATEADDVRRIKRGSGESRTDQQSESHEQRVAATETNEKVAASDFRDDRLVLETTVQLDEAPPKTAAPQRRGNRNDLAATQPKEENPDVATRSVDAALVEAATNMTGDDNSRQRRHHNDADSTQLTGHVAAVDEKTTTLGTPSRFAQHLLSRTGDPNARGPSLTDADQARFVDRVARAVQATGDRGGTLRLRLSPPELGSLTLEIKVQGGAVAARVEADTPAARTLLLENLPLLRERLAELGMRVDQFDVDLTDRHAGGTPEGLPQNDRQQEEDRPRSEDRSRELEETPQPKPQEGNIAIGSGQLNIMV